ncbi:hypothetical protein IQ227_10425 [Anabaena aphanizomenioides LEGE 00250]|uniref:DUF697 domain-containing protein n=1 Tax=Sphaerospermopsis aphanizomenoides LEGE 00250 TaxID=2777972 RepID=A0ABR9VFH0_9CYAN|nr:hypothetical protein [Sphaerospermopsis aphanizomenoides]MBE9236432.1 hypothetical protein [Sphaerospermopsis aphanizomenoides LEGE 00250]
MNQSNNSELAKAGDINAINNLVNEWLQSPSITVKTTLKQDCLQIMLESAEVPEKESIIPCIRDNLLNLSIDSVKKVKIYARETGEDFPDWQEELELNYTLTVQKTESELSTQQPSFFNSFFGAIAGTAEAVGGAAIGLGGAVGGAAMGVGGAVGGAAMSVGGAVGGAAMGVGGAVAGAAMGVGGAAIGLGGAVAGAAMQATQVVGQALAIVGNNPDLQKAIKSLNQDWLNPLIDQVDVVKAEAAVRKLQQEYPNEKPPEIAHRLMLEKSVFAGTSGLVSSLAPGQAAAMFAVDYLATAALSAELVYQIAAAYGMDLQDSERKGEVAAIFGLGLGGKTAIQAGLGLLRNMPVAGAVIGASSNAVMIYGLGYAACQFYEAKKNPLTLEASLIDAQEESEKYLEVAISQTKIMDQILVHIVLAGNPDKSWENILPELKAANLSPASLDEIAAHIKSPPPLEQLLEQLNSDFAVALLAQCEKIANLDEVITPEEAQVIAAIRKRFNYQVV